MRRHPISRETIGLVYYYAYALELTGNYEEEARMLSVVKPMIRTFEWGDTTSLFYRTYRDNLLNAEALLEVRRGQLTRAGQLVNRLHAKIATGDEQNEYEALRAIAENARQEQFGDDHLLEVMRHQPFTTAHELVDTMTVLVEGHRQGSDPNDDLTMFCLQYQ